MTFELDGQDMTTQVGMCRAGGCCCTSSGRGSACVCGGGGQAWWSGGLCTARQSRGQLSGRGWRRAGAPAEPPQPAAASHCSLSLPARLPADPGAPLPPCRPSRPPGNPPRSPSCPIPPHLSCPPQENRLTQERIDEVLGAELLGRVVFYGQSDITALLEARSRAAGAAPVGGACRGGSGFACRHACDGVPVVVALQAEPAFGRLHCFQLGYCAACTARHCHVWY